MLSTCLPPARLEDPGNQRARAAHRYWCATAGGAPHCLIEASLVLASGWQLCLRRVCQCGTSPSDEPFGLAPQGPWHLFSTSRCPFVCPLVALQILAINEPGRWLCILTILVCYSRCTCNLFRGISAAANTVPFPVCSAGCVDICRFKICCQADADDAARRFVVALSEGTSCIM